MRSSEGGSRAGLETRRLVDARAALKEHEHPAAGREETVHCATHVRAILETVFGELAFTAEQGGRKLS